MARTDGLTERLIKGARYRFDGGGTDIRWDGGQSGVTGLGLRIYPSGRKAFTITYRIGKTKRFMMLGDHGVLTLAGARKRARRALADAEDGNDPLETKRRRAQGETLRDLIDAYIERHAKPHKRTWEADKRRLERHIPKSWLPRLARDINNKDIADLHAAIGATRPYEANRWLEIMKTMFRLARVWGFVERNAYNPAADIKKYSEQKRKRWLRPDEVPSLANAIDTEPNVYVRAALWLYLLTGARRAELLGAKWADVDLAHGILRLPETKSGEEQSIPLSKTALAILQAVPRMEKNPYVFPGVKKGRPLVNIYKAWARIREQATLAAWAEDETAANIVVGLTKRLEREPTVAECRARAITDEVEMPVGFLDLRLHDLRRSVGSWLTQSGVDLNRIKDALRHQNISTTLTYARLGDDSAREVLEDHGKRLMKAAKKSRPKVVSTARGP